MLLVLCLQIVRMNFCSDILIGLRRMICGSLRAVAKDFDVEPMRSARR